MNQILIADDDTQLCELLADFLQLDGYSVHCVHRGDEVLATVAAKTFDLLVLDIMLPGTQGLDVLRELRNRNSSLPVIMLTARGDETDRIVGLELGADDYLPKPCNPRELSARIRAVLRRSGPEHEPPKQEVQAGSLHWFGDRHQILCNGQALALTHTEYELLVELLRHTDTAVSKEQLSEKALKRPISSFDRSLDMHISNIRKKLAAAECRESIQTLRAFGYSLQTAAMQGNPS